MDDQKVNRKGGGPLIRAARNFFLAVLIGALVFGFLFGLEGFIYAQRAGPEIPVKGGHETYTALEWVAGQAFGGMIYGALVGVIGWLVLTAVEWLKKSFATI
jgi:hypothetical protein